jgi:hypothetical protein
VLGSGGRWGKSSGATKPFGATTDVLGGGGGGGGGGAPAGGAGGGGGAVSVAILHGALVAW